MQRNGLRYPGRPCTVDQVVHCSAQHTHTHTHTHAHTHTHTYTHTHRGWRESQTPSCTCPKGTSFSQSRKDTLWLGFCSGCYPLTPARPRFQDTLSLLCPKTFVSMGEAQTPWPNFPGCVFLCSAVLSSLVPPCPRGVPRNPSFWLAVSSMLRCCLRTFAHAIPSARNAFLHSGAQLVSFGPQGSALGPHLQGAVPTPTLTWGCPVVLAQP